MPLTLPRAPRPLSRLAAAIATVALGMVSLAPLTHADDIDGPLNPMLYGYSVNTALFLERGWSDLSGWRDNIDSQPTSTGFIYYERQGLISGYITAIMIMVAGAMAASSPKKVESHRSGNYIITTTTYRSDAEKAAIMAASSAAASGVASARHQSFELTLYSRGTPGITGESSGFRTNYMFGIPINGMSMFELGWGFGFADARTKAAKEVRTHAAYVGMPFRLNLAFGDVMPYLQWEWNWMTAFEDKYKITTKSSDGSVTSIGSASSPWRLGVQATLFQRLFGEVAVSTPSLTSGAFAGRAAVGLSF